MGDSELHRVLDILPDLVAQFDREGRFIYVNAAALRAFGAPSEQLIGRTPVEIPGFEESGRELHASIITAVAQRAPRVLEIELETVAGRRAFEVMHAPDLDANGGVRSVMGIARDITAHKEAVAALRAREREYRTLAENTPDVIMRWDRELRRTYGNPAFVAVTGMPLAAVIGTSLASDNAPSGSSYASYLAELARNVREVFTTGEARTVSLTRKTKHGAKVLETRFVPERDERGEIETVLGIARDITRLQESEREARTLADHSPDLIARFDLECRYVFANHTFVDVLGLSVAELRGRKAGEFLATGPLRDKIEEVIATRLLVETEIEVSVGDKRLRFDVRLIPELDESGALASVLAIARDITARCVLEAQLVQAQKMEAVGHVAGAIAHDFNNMLNVMQIQASMALRAGDLESSWARVREILAATERAATLTRELLAFSSRRSASLVELDLGEVVTSITALLAGSLGKAIALQTAIAPSLPAVRGDAGMIEQALTNLAINARDAMPGGGVVEVRIDDAPAASRPGRHVCMTVRDSGCGIAPEIQPRIFEPYFTTKALGKGTGLGLATVFGIVQQHGGWIEVDSAVDRGTAFRLYFPALVT